MFGRKGKIERAVKMLIILGLVILLYFPTATASATPNILLTEILTYHSETGNKADHAFEVVSKIYNSFRQWFFTITFCEFTYFENRILKYTETMDYGYPVVLLSGCPNANRTRTKPKINIHGETAYVITSEELSLDGSEFVIEALLKTGVFKPRSTVIFILNVPVEIDDYFFYTMKTHFQLLWSRSITNSVVMLLRSDKLWTYSYNFFLDKIEDVSDVKNVHNWLYRQYSNLHGHELRLSVFKKPFSTGPDNQPILCNSRLALTVLSELNATCKPLRPRDGNTIGDLLSNGTATGVTADLMDGFTDFELNSRILKNSYYGYIDTTYPLTQDDLCFLIKNDVKQSTFSTIMQIISVPILSIFMFNVIILTIMAVVAREMETRIWKIQERRSHGATVVDLVKCFIRQTVDVKLPAFSYRCLVLMIMVYSLIVNCVIDGVITSAITTPRYWGAVNTMDELIQSNLTLGIHSRHFRMFNRSIDENAYRILQNRMEIVNDKKTRRIIEERQFQYALLLRHVDLSFIVSNLTNQEKGRPIYRIMPDCPLPCSIVYGLRYGSPYLNKISDILHHLNQGGILQMWAKSEELKGNQVPYDSDNKMLKPLTLSNLQGLFVVWALGLLTSTIVFVIEIGHNKKKKTVLKIRNSTPT